MKATARIVFLAVIAGGLAGGAWLASRGTSTERRNLDALVTVGGDAVRDVIQPAVDLTRMSSAEEVRLGEAIDAEVRATLAVGGDARLEAYLDAIGRRLTEGVERTDIPYEITLVRSGDVNAFAVAGGHIYVTEGMVQFAQSEAELAAVLGHEIGHVDRRHCVERLQFEQAGAKIAPGMAALGRLGYELMLRGFSEEKELEADVTGSLLAARSSYDPWAANQLLERLLPEEAAAERVPTHNPVTEVASLVPEALTRYLATHPPADQRIEAVGRLLLARPDLWQARRVYVGRWNLAQRTPISDDSREEEWIVRTTAPDMTGGAHAP